MDQFHMIFFALGFLLNFQIQAQQNSIALLMVIVLTNSIIFTKLRPGRKLENSQNNVSKSSTLRLFFLKTNTSSIDA